MNDREKWRERVRDIRATSTTWWWWWWMLTFLKGSSGNILPIRKQYKLKNERNSESGVRTCWASTPQEPSLLFPIGNWGKIIHILVHLTYGARFSAFSIHPSTIVFLLPTTTRSQWFTDKSVRYRRILKTWHHSGFSWKLSVKISSSSSEWQWSLLWSPGFFFVF